jgi:hypothetical protein
MHIGSRCLSKQSSLLRLLAAVGRQGPVGILRQALRATPHACSRISSRQTSSRGHAIMLAVHPRPDREYPMTVCLDRKR